MRNFNPQQGMASIPETELTGAAAKLLKRQSQTLRKWACTGTGPITPIRINGRLHWKVSDLLALLNGSAK